MVTKKVTVTLPEEQVAAIRRLVVVGKVASVSRFVQHAVAVAVADVAGWGTMLAEALAQTGGELTADERNWADQILDGPAKQGKRPAA